MGESETSRLALWIQGDKYFRDESELRLEKRRLEALERSERERLRLLRERPEVREYRICI